MVDALARNWWMLALRGVFAILFGILAWVWPGITVLSLAILFGAYALTDGVMELYHAFRGGVPGRSRGWLALMGVSGIGLGLIALFWPGATAFVLLMVIAAWAVVTGVFEIVAAIRMREVIDGEWWHVLSGVLSVVFGALLMMWPGSGGLALIWMVGLFSIAFGIGLIAAAFRLRSVGQHAGTRPTGAAPAAL